MKKPVYIRCPRCELNYIQKKDKYCSVCKAEMEAKHDDEEDYDLELCPICKTNYIQPDEIMCSSCLKERRGEDGDVSGDWEDYMITENEDDSDSLYDDMGDMDSVNDLSKAGMLDDDMDDVDFDEEDELDFGEEGMSEEEEEDDLEENDEFEEDDFEEEFEDDLDDDFDDEDDEDDDDDDFDDDDE